MEDTKKVAVSGSAGGRVKETSNQLQHTTTAAILQCASSYAAAGWPVLPIWGLRQGTGGKLVCCCRRGAKCERPGKHPKVQRGIHSATTDLDVIRRWNWQDANLAVAAGQAAGHIVLDVDLRNGGLDSLAALQERFGRLPATQKVLTGDGWHLLFRYPAGVRLATRRLADGVDLLADGSCHIVPQSVHHSGRRYLWDPPLPDGQLPALPDLPDAWLAMLADGQPQCDLPPKDTKGTKGHQRNQRGPKDGGCGVGGCASASDADILRKRPASFAAVFCQTATLGCTRLLEPAGGLSANRTWHKAPAAISAAANPQSRHKLGRPANCRTAADSGLVV